MKQNKSFNDLSIQTKLLLVFTLSLGAIFLVNLYIYYNQGKMMGSIDEIYAGNIELNEMADAVENVQQNMSEYLKTKNTDSLEQYYKYTQMFSNQLGELNDMASNNELLQMERSIKNLGESYLLVTDETVGAKRGRNIEKLSQGYEEATRLYNYINTYIYSLNNALFKDSQMNYDTFLSSMRYSEIFSLTVIAAIAVLAFLLIILVTQTITAPLRALAKRANEVSVGLMDGDLLPIKYEDEVGVVTKAFNQMIVNIRKYIDQIKINVEKESAMKENELKMTAHLKDAQLKYLQAQINPHFLFNTLNAGAQLAMMEGAERTNQYVQNMADFFRYNVKKNNEDVTLAEELTLVDNYIYIINVRFAGDIHFDKEVDESLTHVRVPSMILQPIVENSVNYGVRNIDWEGHISLKVFREGNRACICIEDNGVGIEQEKIDKILQNELASGDISGDSNGVGLANVISRLDLFYNKSDIFQIESPGENQGTRVTIRVPIG